MKNKPQKQVVADDKPEPQIEIQKELEQANLENFVLEDEEKMQDSLVEEDEFDYKKFVDQNIEALGKFGKDFEDMRGLEEIEQSQNNSKDIFESILFGNKNSDED